MLSLIPPAGCGIPNDFGSASKHYAKKWPPSRFQQSERNITAANLFSSRELPVTKVLAARWR
jgi:hypothetical protein